MFLSLCAKSQTTIVVISMTESIMLMSDAELQSRTLLSSQKQSSVRMTVVSASVTRLATPACSPQQNIRIRMLSCDALLRYYSLTTDVAKYQNPQNDSARHLLVTPQTA